MYKSSLTGEWTADCDTFSTKRHLSCRKAEKWYGEDWFLDDKFKVIKVTLQGL